MEDLADLTINNFLDRLADRTPTPGGGGAAGLGGALACAMARMVAAYSISRKTKPVVKERVETFAGKLKVADQLLRALITEDATAYTRMATAAKADREAPTGRAPYDEAILKAISVPMEMGALASNALAAMDDFKAVASRYLLSDLGVAAVLAEATVRAAEYSVRINAGELTDPAARSRVLSEIEQNVTHAARHRESIEVFVRGNLEGGP